MRPRLVLSEAYRNLVTGTTRAWLLGMMLAMVCSAAAIADARTIIGLERKAADFRTSAASMRVLVARGATDVATCDRLGSIDGIRAAGALAETDAVVLRGMVANPIPAYRVSPGFLAVLGGRAGAAEGAWIPADLARTLAVRPGQRLPTMTGTLQLAGVYDYPDDGRDRRLAYAVLLPQPVRGLADECWADVWPVSTDRDRLLYSALAVHVQSTEPVTIGQVNTSRGSGFDGVSEFTDRVTRFAGPGCVLAGLLLGLVSVRLRRLEIAAALHLGESRAALLATLFLETAAWAVFALALAAAVLVLAAWLWSGSARPGLFLLDIRGPVAGSLAALAGAWLALLRIREKHLFGYFKER